jgi:hypothetical protein
MLEAGTSSVAADSLMSSWLHIDMPPQNSVSDKNNRVRNGQLGGHDQVRGPS